MAYRERRPDEEHMRIALNLACKGKTLPYPNPWVGCVIVRDGTIVGRGFHLGPGTNHAEIEALIEAGAHARNSTLYVNLEPCCHTGRTPPCSDAILRAGVRCVVYALRDPNPDVCGRGAAILKRGGIEIRAGVLAREAAALNEVYFKFRRTGLPFVTAKAAASLDGKIATRAGESRWITGAAARRRARELRAQHQAILVGIHTVQADNPHLGSRIPKAQDPWRVVLDSRLRVAPGARVVAAGRCIIATTQAASAAQREALKRAGAEVWSFRGKRVPLAPLLRRLAARGILSVMVEGGGEVLGSFFDGRFVDRVYWFLSPLVIGSGHSRAAVAGRGVARLAQAAHLREVSVTPVGGSWMIRGNASRWALR